MHWIFASDCVLLLCLCPLGLSGLLSPAVQFFIIGKVLVWGFIFLFYFILDHNSIKSSLLYLQFFTSEILRSRLLVKCWRSWSLPLSLLVPLGMFKCGRYFLSLVFTADILLDILLLLGQVCQGHLALRFLSESLSFSFPVTAFCFQSLCCFLSQSRMSLLTSFSCVVALLGSSAFKISITCFSYFSF